MAFGKVHGLKVHGPTESQFHHSKSQSIKALCRCQGCLATDRLILVPAQGDICKDGPEELAGRLQLARSTSTTSKFQTVRRLWAAPGESVHGGPVPVLRGHISILLRSSVFGLLNEYLGGKQRPSRK